jgi:ornithine decarboxylase
MHKSFNGSFVFLQGLSATKLSSTIQQKCRDVLRLPLDMHKKSFQKDSSYSKTLYDFSNKTTDQSVLLSHPKKVTERVNEYKTKLPFITPYYAIKCNSEKFLLNTLSDSNLNYDCASENEIEKVVEHTHDHIKNHKIKLNKFSEKTTNNLKRYSEIKLNNFSEKTTNNLKGYSETKLNNFSERMILSNPFKTVRDLMCAKKYGISLTVADTQDELKKIKEVYPQARVLWRISVKSNARIQMSDKFGASIDNLDKDLKFAKDLGINLVGIHFHRGSGGDGNLTQSFKSGVVEGLKAINLMKKMNFNKDNFHKDNFSNCVEFSNPNYILDIGGGFSGEGLGDEASYLHDVSKELLTHNIIMKSEPGRLFGSESMTLITKIIGKRPVDGGFNYHINDSVYHNFSCVPFDKVDLFKHGNKPYSMVDKDGTTIVSDLHNSNLLGFTCDGLDVIGKGYQLPELNVGDHIVFGGMGAYTKASATEFNGMPSGFVV